MPFVKGQAKKGGRAAGTPNSLTKTVKERVLEVFNDLQNEPNVNLFDWAKTEPTEFYKIAAKLIPSDINAKIDGKVITVIPPSKKED
jgi:hypothetical protein